EAAGEVKRGHGASRAVGYLAVGKDSVQKAIAVPLDGVGDTIDVGGVESESDDVRHERQLMNLPQPTDGFAWAQAPAGPALVCRALEPFARHFFSTRS